MSFDVKSLIDEIRAGAKDCPRATALGYVQLCADELNEELRLTSDLSEIPYVANQSVYSIDVDITKIYSVVPVLALSQQDPIKQVSIRELEQDFSDFRGTVSLSQTAQIPCYVYEADGTGGARALGIYPMPTNTTLAVSGATNASPIQITTSTPHGLSDAAAVLISGVVGNPAANGTFYIDVTSAADPTKFNLYTDALLTIPVVGNGAYTSGGIIATVSVGFLRLYVSRSQDYTDSTGSILPASVTSINAYKEYAWWMWASANHKDEQASHWQNFLLAKAVLKRRKTNFLIDVHPKSKPYVRQLNAAK